MEDKRKRTNNFTSDEKKILSELVLKYQNIIENKRSDANTNAEKQKGWIRLAEEFNNYSTFCHRNHNSLKTCWENIKRQVKKDCAEKKKQLFMTGGGHQPPPAPDHGSCRIVEAVLGPALEGLYNPFDSDAVEETIISVNTDQQPILKDIKQKIEYPNQNNIVSSGENIIILNVDSEDKENTVEDQIIAGPPKSVSKDNDVDESWNEWTPKSLKRPISEALKVQSKDEWTKRRRPKNESLADTLMQEKIKLVKILQENALKESHIRLAILEEQLKQEQLKTKKLTE